MTTTAAKLNILIVDDQPGKRLSYEVLLSDLGENLLTADSANQALELLLKNEVAVILVDVCMPDLDGFELARIIREHPRFQKIAIIFISAIHLAESDHLKGYGVGAVDYLPVPFVPELLRAKVRIFVDLYRKTKQLEQLNKDLEHRVAERTRALEVSNSMLVQSEQGRTLALAAGNMGSWTYRADADSWEWDEGLSLLVGADSPEPFNGTASIEKFLAPESRTALGDAIERTSPKNSSFQIEVQICRLDGEARDCFVTAVATFDGAGSLRRVDGVMVDITDRKMAERSQMLLAQEVDHRARNALAVVQAIVRLTRSDSIEEYTEVVERRLHALANAHELLSKSRWRGADLRNIVEDETAPYDARRVSAIGPSVILRPEKAQAIALALHELATNAAKYGALSSTVGTVSVRWSYDNDTLSLQWIESNGPPVAIPARSGFGSKIIHASLDPSRGDAAKLDWRQEGLNCTITLHCGDMNDKHQVRHDDSHRSTAHDGKHVLVVEDEALVGMLTCDYLEEIGYVPVGPYRNEQDARAALAADTFDIALVDLNLSGRPVYSLVDALTQKGIPVVFLTGYSADGIDARFSEFDIVSKPIQLNALASALRDACSRKLTELRESA
jgi:two-component sensor histidine kinase/DNA-binding response OmpR family regulator